MRLKIPERFVGVRVIGDVHGDTQAFAPLIEGGEKAKLFVIQLGDLVDRGPDSPGCLKLAFDMLARHTGLFILGNHDDKLRRALAPDSKVIRGKELTDTLAAIDADPDAVSFRSEIVRELEMAPLWLRFGSYLAVHGGFDPRMLLESDRASGAEELISKSVRNRALRGQARKRGEEVPLSMSGADYPERIYDWIDAVPEGMTVLIGHDAVSMEEIVTRKGALGGYVKFCDTGCGKGGKLSWVDIPRTDW